MIKVLAEGVWAVARGVKVGRWDMVPNMPVVTFLIDNLKKNHVKLFVFEFGSGGKQVILINCNKWI